ncbi:phage tail assembly chaperone (plasmid) [Xenorhabdus sp. SF857]|uniref:phage tail assembly chaperone n=1 Tax=Xenorhabdus bakwenae TaxID=3026967 RepID=UPI0025581872|nr:phage tail assembly chaperone [Xenorhabdus sp. SF857]WFQ78143.1 phage tail assembly chaperone [Xenorhabdus sp. SF857]
MDLSEKNSGRLIVTERGLVHPKWIEIIEIRAALLKEADNLVNVALDNDLDSKEVRAYRQKLRNIPQSFEDPFSVVWPDKPILQLSK